MINKDNSVEGLQVEDITWGKSLLGERVIRL